VFDEKLKVTCKTNTQGEFQEGTWIVQNQCLFLNWDDPTDIDNGNIPNMIQGNTLTLDVNDSHYWEEVRMSIFSRQ
tara:strand:+ start:1208 stop:1435 length:228 start_codon:yes stop_codon:yes gene_type:complete